jgi:tetratricopeptide (TPR) repeat protein
LPFLPSRGKNMALMSKCFRLLLVLLLMGTSTAQSPKTAQDKSTEAKPSETKPDYSKEAFIDEQDSTKVTAENDGTSNRTTSTRIRIQSDAGVQRYGVLTFPYQNAIETIAIDYVRVQKPDGTTIITPEESIQDMPAEITRQAPFYSDLREKHIAVKGLGAGDILEYQVHWQTTKPLAPGQFWFAFNAPRDFIVLHWEFQVSLPRDRTVKWKSSNIQPAITEDGGRRIFDWTGSQLEQASAEQEKKDQEEKLYQTARGRLPPPDIQISTFQSWQDVGAWYNALQQDRVKPNGEIRSKAAELTKNAADESARLHAIYNYVSLQFRYIGVAFGIGRYQPHAAAEVLANQYGDCKDKHTLLASLLDAAGINAYPTLISATRELDPDVPSPAQFDHVITVVPQGNGLLWLDTTPEVAPYGYLLSRLWDKQALVIPTGKAASLVTTPAEPAAKALETFHIDAKLKDDGTLEGKIERSASGNDSEVLLRNAFRKVPMPQWKDLVQRISYASGFSGDVNDISASPPEKTDEAFRFSYTYTRKDFPQWSERRIGSPLPPLLAEAPENRPNHPILLGTPGEMRSESKVELPHGYSPQLPAAVGLKNDFADYRAAYSVNQGVLRTERSLTIKMREVPVADYESYKKFAKAVGDDQNLYVALKSGASRSTNIQEAIQNLPLSDNPEATGAFDAALGDARTGDMQGAIISLREAVDTDPQFTRAWLMLIAFYATTAQREKEIETIRKASGTVAQQPEVYKAFVVELIRLREYQQAVPLLQKLITLDPSDLDTVQVLSEALKNLKEYQQEIGLLESALKTSPDESWLYFRLGDACIHAGDEQKALVAYKKALEMNSDPDAFNAVGYELADAGKQLPLALQYAERGVREEEEASAKIKLSELKKEDLRYTPNVGAFWDTLGWAHFRLGNLDKAEKYLNAAWMLSQDAPEADHLGQVYELEHKKSEAIRMYRLALAASHSPDQMKETAARLEHLGGTTSSGRFGPNGVEELNKLRTIKLEGLKSDAASAEFFVLLTSGSKVEDVKFISGSEKLKSAEKYLREAAFKASFPDDGPTKLLRRGILSCSSITGCAFVLYTPDTVRSVN